MQRQGGRGGGRLRAGIRGGRAARTCSARTARSRSSRWTRPGPARPFARFAAAEAQGPAPVRELGSPSPSRDYPPRPWRFTATSSACRSRLAWDRPTGGGAILEARAGALEIVSPEHADLIDKLGVGRRIAGPVRLALEVEDSARTAAELVAGAEGWPLPRRRRGAT